MVPAMIYLLRMPTNVVIGTSIFQIIFVTAVVTVLPGDLQLLARCRPRPAPRGGRRHRRTVRRTAGQKFSGEQLRAMLALMVLAVALRLLFDLVLKPSELYSLSPLLAGA